MVVLRGGEGTGTGPQPTPAVERTPAQHPVSWGSSGAPDPGGPQSLAGPTALLDSAGRSDLLRFASARPPLTASGLDSGDGRSSERPVIRVLGGEPQPHARTTTALTPWTLARVNLGRGSRERTSQSFAGERARAIPN